MACSAVGYPVALGTREAAFGRDENARAVTASRRRCRPRDPCRERPRDEPFVVTGLAVVPAVRVGRIEKGRAGIERGVQHGGRPGLVAVALGRQPHAAHSNQPTSRLDG